MVENGAIEHMQEDEQGTRAASGAAACSTTHAPEADAVVLASFRKAFSHLESDVYITSELLPEQQLALEAYRQHFGLKPKDPWAPEQLHHATPQELTQMDEFRARLEADGKLSTEDEKAYCTDIMLLRYLRARDHHLDKALHMYEHTLAWRSSHRPQAMSNAATRTNKHSSDARVVGFDRLGRVVVYSSFAKTLDRTPDYVQLNTTCMMEKANLLVHAGSPGSVVWVNHFGAHHKNGFSWRDCNPRFAWAALDIFSNHYPECLATMMIIDPPSVFFTLWKVVKPLLPEKTQQKGQFFSSSADNRPLFDDVFGEELAAYILSLIQQDRA